MQISKGFRGRLLTTAGWLVFAAIASLQLYAQSTATVLGTVKDQSGAVLPGANITLTNVDTGISRTTVSGSRGEYRVPALQPGSYEAKVELTGFQSEVRRGITLRVGQDAAIDFTLSVGNVAESVTITADAPLIETTNAVVSRVVDPTMMREMPLNNRSFLDLVPMTGGAIFVETADSSATKGFGRKLAIGGTRYTENSFLLDGANMNDAAGAAGSADGSIAGVESVREFRVISNAYDAEHGRHTGGVISAISKSGTNGFHGTIFEFLRNDNLDAANWADFARGDDKPEFRRNQFGGAIGGPIKRDQTFFFGNFEGLRESLGQTQVFNVPGPNARQGNLVSGPVAIAPQVRPFLDAYPLPNGTLTGDAGIYSAGRDRVTDHDYWLARGDHRISDSDSLAFRYVRDTTSRENPEALATGELHSTESNFANVELVHIFSPTLISKSMIAFNRTDIAISDYAIEGITIPKPSFTSLTDGFGNFGITGLATFGGGTTNPKRNVQNDYQIKQDFTLTLGVHALKFGFHYDRFQVNQRSEARGFGTFTFPNLTRFFAGDPEQATFLRPGSDTIRGYRESLIGMYLQDDIRLTDRLTMNLGVRYEFITTPTEANGKIANIRDLREHFLYSFGEADVSVGSPWYLNPSLLNFAPRVGFAYDVFGNGKTSFRAGAGVFHSQLLPSNLLTWGVRVPPFFVNVFLERTPLLARTGQTIDFPNTFFTQPFVTTPGLGGLARADGFQWNPEQPTVYKWSSDIEHEIVNNLSVQLGYSGTRAVHNQRGPLQIIATLGENRNLGGDNRLFIQTGRPYPSQSWSFFRWAYTDGTSDYHALRVNLNKRFSGGLQFATSYTYSKTTDTGSNWTGSNDFQGSIRGYRDTKLPALSAFDFRHNFSTNFVYDLPGANLTGAAKAVLGGWSLGGLLRFNSGSPLVVTMQLPSPNGNAPVGVDGPSLNLIPGGSNNPVLDGGRNPDEYFDIRQFSVPLVCENVTSPGCPGDFTGYFQGNLGSNTLIAPGIANLDVNFSKETDLPFLGEGGTLQFRAEFYNILNRPNFGDPVTQIFSRPRTGANLAGDLADPYTRRRQTAAARIDSTRTSSRQLQFGVKVIF